MFSVVANPYCAPLDQAGRPCGAVLVEQPPGRYLHEWVGARLNKDETKHVEPPVEPGRLRSRRQQTVFTFSDQPVSVPESRYYRRLIQTGQLFASDKRTAQKCGIKPADFRDPKTLLEEAKAMRERERIQTYGDRLEAPELDAAEAADAAAAQAEAEAKAAEDAVDQAKKAAKESKDKARELRDAANASKKNAAATSASVRANRPASESEKGSE